MARIEIAIEDQPQDDDCGPKLRASFKIPPAPDNTALAQMSLHAAADIQQLIRAGAIGALLVTSRSERHNALLACLLDFLCECAEKPAERWQELFDELDAFAENARRELASVSKQRQRLH